ncbi:unnamed protein product [Closterium sp. Yama58-4]|nr:unnamed protein product [Closterium sp. Yama58-4]
MAGEGGTGNFLSAALDFDLNEEYHDLPDCQLPNAPIDLTGDRDADGEFEAAVGGDVFLDAQEEFPASNPEVGIEGNVAEGGFPRGGIPRGVFINLADDDEDLHRALFEENWEENASRSPTSEDNATCRILFVEPARGNVNGPESEASPHGSAHGVGSSAAPAGNAEGQEPQVAPQGNAEGQASQAAPQRNADGPASATHESVRKQADVASRIRRAKVPYDYLAAKTRKDYILYWLHYKWWVIMFMSTLPKTEVPAAERLDPLNPDEVGSHLGNDKKAEWSTVDLDEVYLHGPRVTGWRIQRFLRYMAEETPAQAEMMRRVVAGKEPIPSTPSMMKAKMSALGFLGRLEARLYDYPKAQADEYIGESREYMKLKLKQLHDKQVMIQLAHQMLGRGCSIRSLRFANMFVRHTRSSTAVPDRQKDLPVVVFASRKSKTNATNRLTHQFLARHINFALCGVGGLFLWIHFVYDLVPLRFGADIIPPLDFSDPLQWSKKHIFFPLRHGREQLQEELPYVTHNNWINWVMNDVARPPWRISKKTHAFRRSGAQGLSDDRCPDPDINALGGWEQGEMRKSYVVGVPFWPVLMMAGFSGEPGDYYIGRAHAKLDNDTEWKQLQDLFKLFIFPRLESDLAKVDNYNRENPDKPHHSGRSFLEALANPGRDIVAQDLAMWWFYCPDHDHLFDGTRRPCQCPRHPYTDMNPLCRHHLFQKWAIKVAIMHKAGIELREARGTSAAADAIYKLNSSRKYQKLLVENNLWRTECGQKDHEIGVLKNRLAETEEREKKTAAENKQLKEELAALKARAESSANAQAADRGSGSSAKEEAGGEAPKPGKAQASTPVRAFFDLVVKPWRDSESVAKAWEHWVKVTFLMEGKTLRQLSSEKSFYPTFSYIEKGVKDDAGDKKMKRMRNVMLAVEKYRANETEEATRDAIAKIEKGVVGRSSISALADGVILGNEPPPKRDNPGKDKTTENKRRKVGYLLFAAQMVGDGWGEKMFGKDVWKKIKIEEPLKLAKLKK